MQKILILVLIIFLVQPALADSKTLSLVSEKTWRQDSLNCAEEVEINLDSKQKLANEKRMEPLFYNCMLQKGYNFAVQDKEISSN